MIYSAGRWNATLHHRPSSYPGWMANSPSSSILQVNRLWGHIYKASLRVTKGKARRNQYYPFSPYSRLILVRIREQIQLLTICRKFNKWTSSQWLLARKNKYQSHPKVRPPPSPPHGSPFHLAAVLCCFGRPGGNYIISDLLASRATVPSFLQRLSELRITRSHRKRVVKSCTSRVTSCEES